MEIKTNISLKKYNTFGIDVPAKYFVSVTSIQELEAVLKNTNYPEKLILGGGSNILLTKPVNALVIHINLKGKQVITETNDHVWVKAQSGENWHKFVLWAIQNNFGGIENLSLIPGNVGTTPIQNIGAYGVEIKDVLHECEALNIENLQLKKFTNTECNFGYRNSIFKQNLKGKFIITSVTFKLSKNNHTLHTSYGAIKEQLQAMQISNPTISDVSNAVIAIRQSKLPDPKKMGNSGSFFKNPIVSSTLYLELKTNFPNIPSYPVSNTKVKIPAGWLIEKAGFKGKNLGNYGVHENQALVLVNYGNANGKDIFKLATIIQKTVQRIFNITLEPEVNIL